MAYDDRTVACTDDELVIRRYYFPRGTKRIPYHTIKQVRRVHLDPMGWRVMIWGSSDLVHWWNLDLHRSDHPIAFIIDIGSRMRPVITPEDAARVTAELVTHGVYLVPRLALIAWPRPDPGPWHDGQMTESDRKADLRRYLQDARDALLWKLDGLSEYDIRRPLVPTGTNLLGLVKHVAGGEMAYFGDTFGRPCPDQLAWDESDPMSDMFAFPDESREFITGLYRRAWAHSDATIEALPLDTTGHVPWWPPERNEVTLHHILVRVAADTSRHAGQADIVRELIDGEIGLTAANPNLPPGDQGWRQAHYDRVEYAAQEAAKGTCG